MYKKNQYSKYENPSTVLWKPQYSMYGNPWHQDFIQLNHIFQNAGQWDKTVKDSERSNSMLLHFLTEWLSAVADTVFVINTHPSPSTFTYTSGPIYMKTNKVKDGQPLIPICESP